MESLNSFKDNYSDFRLDLREKMENRNGRVKDGIIYGSYYEVPIEKQSIVFYFHKEDIQNAFFQKLIRQIFEGEIGKADFVKCVIEKDFSQGMLPKGCQGVLLNETEDEAKRTMACSEMIIAGNGLPKYFVRRKEQMVVRFISQTKGSQGRIWKAQNRISWIMNSSLIFVNREEDKTAFEKAYQLNDFFDGKIRAWAECRIQEMNLEKFKKMIEEDKKQTKESVSSKKKVLILNGQGLREEGKMIRIISDSLNPKQYDITLAMKKSLDAEDEDVDELNSNIRLMYREGSFSCNIDEYIDIQYLLKNFHAFDHIEKAYEYLNREIVERECRRLWGNTVFDTVIYVGNHSAVWPVIAGGTKAKKKIRIESRNLKEEIQKCRTKNKKRSFFNMQQLYQMIFHSIVFPSKARLSDAVAQHFISPGKGMEFDYPVLNVIPKEKQDQDVIWYENQRYLIEAKKKNLYGNEQLELLPFPEEKRKTYIMEGNGNDAMEVLKLFSKGNLVLFTEEKYHFKRLKDNGQTDKIRVVDPECLGDIPYLSDYLEYFEGYIAAGEKEEYSPIRICMEFLGKETLRYEKYQLKKEDKKCFESQQQYLEYMEKRWENFLNK